MANEITRRETRANKAQAAKLAHILIGSYPGREIFDREVYSRAIISVFMEHTTEIGRQAVDRITRRSKFLPTRADVVEALEEAERPAFQDVEEALNKQRRARQHEDARRAAEIRRDPIPEGAWERFSKDFKTMVAEKTRITGRGGR